MDKIFQKFRTPILFFCIGVLFSVLLFWFYLEKDSISEKDMISIKSNVEDLSVEEEMFSPENKVYIGGDVPNSQICDLIINQDWVEQILRCAELTGSLNLLALKDTLVEAKNCSDCNSFILIHGIDISEPEVEGSSTSLSEKKSLCVNINVASASELDSLPGIGPVYAERIIENRPYSSKVDIKRVKGIGDKTFLKLEPLICL